jgi:hypothetical protein
VKKVYSSADRLLIGFLQGVLQDHQVDSYCRNEILAGGMGEIPPIECWPELWVVKDEDASAARHIIDNVLAGRQNAEPWRCDTCGEMIEPQFAACWRCTPDKQ